MLLITTMNNFIEKYLKIKKYNIYYFNSWRNNITCFVIFFDKKNNEKKIVIQKLSEKISKNTQFLIETLIKNWKKINLSQNYFKKRFFEFEWNTFQVMKYIAFVEIKNKEMKQKNILSMFKYLAIYTNMSENIFLTDKQKKIWKTFKSINELFFLSEKFNKKDNSFDKIFKKIIKLKSTINIIETNDDTLKSWIIHWDTAFKNFLFNDKGEAISIIDYEKVEYNN